MVKKKDIIEIGDDVINALRDATSKMETEIAKDILKNKAKIKKSHIQGQSNLDKDFKASLVEVQKPEPSVGGTIAGMDFRQFAATQVFFLIVEQEKYVVYTKKI